MIVELSVENLAIIDRAHLSLGPGFTALTGETGAGKSLLIDAMQLALGGRADTDQVRSGAVRAVVSMVVDLSGKPGLVARLAEAGTPMEDETLYIQREVFAEGKSQCRIGGKLVPVSALKQLGNQLVDLHGQHDHQALLDSGRHLGYLDSWIGEPADEALARVADRFERAQATRRKLDALRRGRRELEQRIDLLQFQLAEIDAVEPLPGETQQQEEVLERLKHAEKLATASLAATELLSSAEVNGYDLVALAIRELEGVTRFDPALQPFLEQLSDAAIRIQEAARALQGYSEGLDADPAVLDAVANRLDALRTLRRKYGDDERAVLAHREQLRAELEDLTFGADDEEGLASELASQEATLREAAAGLSELRKARAVAFAEAVQAGLQELAMDRARFEVSFEEVPIDAGGQDRAEFYFSANAGEPPRALAKIASGGELSRVMLAIKAVFAGRAGVPTLIFDEVDAGLSGRAAVAVAKKLEALAGHYQVLVISHLPQIASRATAHFRIEKVERGGRVITDIHRLVEHEREEEIARMLAGDTITGSALANARDLLAHGTLFN